jgi:hypothetical protein
VVSGLDPTKAYRIRLTNPDRKLRRRRTNRQGDYLDPFTPDQILKGWGDRAGRLPNALGPRAIDHLYAREMGSRTMRKLTTRPIRRTGKLRSRTLMGLDKLLGKADIFKKVQLSLPNHL